MTLGTRLKQLRESMDMSREELAKEAQIEPSYISKLERNKAPNVSAAVLSRLARALHVDLGVLAEAAGLSDKARIRKYYSLVMLPEPDEDDESDVKNLHSGVNKVHSRYEPPSQRTRDKPLEEASKQESRSKAKKGTTSDDPEKYFRGEYGHLVKR